MGVRYCKCETMNGQLCRHCGKGYHFSFHHKSHRYTGDTSNRCWQVLRRSRAKTLLCEGHVEPWCECDSCGATAPTLPAKLGYFSRRFAEGWQEIAGLSDKKLLLCPSCVGTFRVGLDWSLEKNGESLQVSIACAFAFQLGQNAWHRPELLANMSPDYAPGSGSGPCKVCGDPFDHGGRPHSEASRVQPPLTVAHVLDSGLTLCGLWPEQMGGAWVRVEHWQQADCRICRRRAAERMGVALASGAS